MNKTITILAFMAFGAIALSTNASWKVFQEKYGITKESNIGTAACTTCHIGKHGGKLNLYGKDLKKVLDDQGTKKLTPEMLAKIEGLDSTKSGKSNIAKIKSDVSPGAE